MRNFAGLIAALALLGSTSVFAEEAKTYPSPQEGAPDVYKQLFDNDQVRVSEIQFDPGEKAPMHHHAYPHVVYILEGGELTITPLGGAPQVVKAKPGDVMYMAVETHEAVNTGTTPLRAMVTEIK